MDQHKQFLLYKFQNRITNKQIIEEICEDHSYVTETTIQEPEQTTVEELPVQIASIQALCPFPSEKGSAETSKAKKLCETYLKKSLTPEQQKKMWQKVRQKVIDSGVDPNFKKMKPSMLVSLFDAIDEVYWGNKLRSFICSSGDQLEFGVKYLPSTAGKAWKIQPKFISKHKGIPVKACQTKYKDGTYLYYFEISTLFTGLFSEKKTPLISNGVECFDRLDCLQNIFCHELTHIIMFRFCEVSGYKDKVKHGHGEYFNKIALNMYGFTQYKHNLFNKNLTIDDVNRAQKIKDSKIIKKGMRVEVSIPSKDNGKPFWGTVKGVGVKFTTFSLNIDNSTKYYPKISLNTILRFEKDGKIYKIK